MPGGEGICAVVGCAGEGYGFEAEKRLDVWDGGMRGNRRRGWCGGLVGWRGKGGGEGR